MPNKQVKTFIENLFDNFKVYSLYPCYSSKIHTLVNVNDLSCYINFWARPKIFCATVWNILKVFVQLCIAHDNGNTAVLSCMADYY